MLKKLILFCNLLLIGFHLIVCAQNREVSIFYKEIGFSMYATLFILIPLFSGLFAVIGALFSSSCEPFKSRYIDAVFIISLGLYSTVTFTSSCWEYFLN